MMSSRSSVIDTLIEKAQGRIFLDIGRAAPGMPGWSVMDLREGAEVRHDPLDFPWPLEDQSVFYIRCMDFIQRIPHACKDHPRDPFLEFAEECWRVMIPGGTVWVSTPHASTQGAYRDPYFRRVLSEDTFKMLSLTERRERHMPEDLTFCNFTVTHGFTYDVEGIIQELHTELTRHEDS